MFFFLLADKLTFSAVSQYLFNTCSIGLSTDLEKNMVLPCVSELCKFKCSLFLEHIIKDFMSMSSGDKTVCF